MKTAIVNYQGGTFRVVPDQFEGTLAQCMDYVKRKPERITAVKQTIIAGCCKCHRLLKDDNGNYRHMTKQTAKQVALSKNWAIKRGDRFICDRCRS